MELEFKAYSKIPRLENSYMIITQKLHGTNGQIYITPDLQIFAGSRNRLLSINDDNYGFANYVETNKEQLIKVLGEGRHYGEWCGKGINSGEGLIKKCFYLFDIDRYKDIERSEQIDVVPCLYRGKFNYEQIALAMELLKKGGSQLVAGFMKPEGIVIWLEGQRFKMTFETEETGWDAKKDRLPQPSLQEKMDKIVHLLQPLRLQKLILRDEKYIREYPQNIAHIVKDYAKDLEDENQFSKDEDIKKEEKKLLGKFIFQFIKTNIYLN
jgi:hypothetical protein